MKKITRCFFIYTLAFLVAVFPFISASAQSTQPVQPAQVGGYIGVWGGFTIAPAATSGEYYDDYYYYYDYDLDMQETWALGGKIGYTIPLKYFAFEFEYGYLNPDIERSIIERYGPDYTAVEGDVKLNNFMLNAIVKYPIGRFHPYFGGGIGFSYSDMSATATQTYGADSISTSIGKDHSAFAWQLLTGVEFDITNNLSVDIGYRYFATELEFQDTTEIYFENDNSIDFTTSMLTLGLKILF